MGPTLTCKICFEAASRDQVQARVTLCGHVMCGTCATVWFRSNSTCPVCRRPLDVHLGLITVFDDQDAEGPPKREGPAHEGGGEGVADRGAPGADSELHVLSTLTELGARWQSMVIERATLCSRVGGLEDERRILQQQLDRALYENRRLQRLLAGAVVGAGGQGGEGSGEGEGEGDDGADRELSLFGGVRWQEAGHFDAHQEPIHGIAVHQGSEPLVATASWDHTCQIYDISKGEVVQELAGHEQGLYAVQFAPTAIDPNLVGTVSSDTTARLWSSTTGATLATLGGHTGEVNGLSFCGPRGLVSTASDDRTALIWDVASAQVVQVLRGHEKEVYGIAFHPDGHMVATVSFDQSTRLWDPRSGEVIRRLQGHTDDVIGVDLDASGALLATGSDDTTAVLWDTRTWASVAVLKEHGGAVKRVRFSPHGRLLATTSGDATLRVFDTRTFECGQHLEGHTDHVFDCAFSSSCDFLVSGSHDRTWKLWRPP